MARLSNHLASITELLKNGPKVSLNRVMPGVHLDFENNVFYECPIGGNPTYFSSFDAMFTCTGSLGTYFDSTGLLQNATTNISRRTYNMETPDTSKGEYWGLLAESPATNLALWARDQTNAVWTKTTMTTAQTSTGLDGVTSSCTRLTASAGNATSLQSITSVSAARVLSFYIKRITGSGSVQVTLDNGTGWTTVTLGTGWTRVQKTQTLANPTIGIRLVTNGDAIDVDCCQLENNSGQRTSPIITTTASVTRTVDLYTRTYASGTLVVDRAKAQGTYYTKCRPFIAQIATCAILANQVDAGFFIITGATNSAISLIAGGVTDSGPTITPYSLLTIAATGTSDLGYCTISRNGASTKINNANTNTITNLGIFAPGGGDTVNGRPFNGTILRLDYWPFIYLSGSETQALSSNNNTGFPGFTSITDLSTVGTSVVETAPIGATTCTITSFGGGGGGADSVGVLGGGGGGGAKCVTTVSVNGGDKITYTVGAKGLGASVTGSGTDATATTTTGGIGGFAGIAHSAGGGLAGTITTGGAAGTASGGVTNVNGNAGTTGTSGSGGAAAASGGGNGGTNDTSLGGNNSTIGITPGGGGGAGFADNGKNGANGQISFVYT